MSIFSEKLKEYIEQKKVSVYALAKSCGMDRSNMYKIVQGTRQPMSDECIENISHTLCLSPFEKSKLLEAWRISRNGEYIYYESKLIFSFIENLQKESLPESPAAKTAQSPSAPIPGSIPVEMSVRYLKDTASCGVDIKAFINESQAYMKRSIYAEDYRVFFTEEGLRDFMDNGHIVDMTADSFKLFSKADRLAALENMRKIMSEKNVAAYLIHSDSLKMQRDFYMTVYSDGKCDIMFKNAKSKWRIFSITEKSLGNSFYNFGKYLSESSYACGRKESIECVDKLISEYKKIYKHQEEN